MVARGAGPVVFNVATEKFLFSLDVLTCGILKRRPFDEKKSSNKVKMAKKTWEL